MGRRCKGKTLVGIDPAVVVRGNRYEVNEFNQVKGYTDIFAVGDIAAMITAENPGGRPMLASVAQQNGKQLAKNLVKLVQKKEMQPFHYVGKGSMATIGRNRAVVDLPFLKFKGFIARLAWMFIHLMLLVSFRNRLIVFINWMWNYFAYERTIRLIIRPYQKKKAPK